MALDRCRFLALAFLGRLFEKLAAARFSDDARFFAGTLEPPQGIFKRLIFFDLDARH